MSKRFRIRRFMSHLVWACLVGLLSLGIKRLHLKYRPWAAVTKRKAMRKVVPTVRFAPEYGAYPLWINTTNEEGISLPEAPEELADCPEVLENLDRIEAIYHGLFINNEFVFFWKGFDTPEAFEDYKALVSQTLAMLHEQLDGIYVIEDHTWMDPKSAMTPWTPELRKKYPWERHGTGDPEGLVTFGSGGLTVSDHLRYAKWAGEDFGGSGDDGD